MRQVSVIIPQRGHQTRLTEPLIAAIQKWEPEAEILVVDDADQEHYSPRDIPGARMLANRGRGVTAAWNLGCQRAMGDAMVLLNNDVICTGPFLKTLLARAGQGIAGTVMRPDPDLSMYVLEGWCLAFSREVLNRLGGFDESMRIYFSDTDFQYRAHTAGLILTSVPISTLRHLGHRTAHDRSIVPNRSELWRADRQTFLRKWELSE